MLCLYVRFEFGELEFRFRSDHRGLLLLFQFLQKGPNTNSGMVCFCGILSTYLYYYVIQ